MSCSWAIPERTCVLGSSKYDALVLRKDPKRCGAGDKRWTCLRSPGDCWRKPPWSGMYQSAGGFSGP